MSGPIENSINILIKELKDNFLDGKGEYYKDKKFANIKVSINDKILNSLDNIKEYNNKYIINAKKYINSNFKNAFGNMDIFYYPCTHKDAEHALNIFLEQKLEHFGIYEDAMLYKESTLFHSVLSPLINIGLISVNDFIGQLEKYYQVIEQQSTQGTDFFLLFA